MRVTRFEDGARITDDANNTVRFHADDWAETDTAVCVRSALDGRDVGPDDPETVVSGAATRLEFPPVFVAAIPLSGGEQTEFGGNLTEIALPDDAYLLRIDATVRAFLRVDGAMELHRESGEKLWVSFPEARSFEVAFDSRVDLPDGTVTVPETPDGVAAGLSTLSSGNDTLTPDRTWPTMRGRAPLLEFGDSVQVPDAVAERVESTGIEIVVPPTLDALVPVASLAHYLGADVTCEADASPRVEVAGRTHSLSDVASLPDRAADLLRRTFYLDCVARGAGPHGGTLSVADTFDTLGLDTERLYEASMAERVQTYLAADFDSVREAFPEWHLTMHVEPTYEHAATLPYLVDNVPFVVRPEGERIDKRQWLELSLTDDGFTNPAETRRTRSGGYGRREVSNIDLLQPSLGPGRTHGWLADGVPIDAFKALPEAYRHRDDALDDPGEGLSVTAVVNDSDIGPLTLGPDDELSMRTEHEAAVEQYRDRAEELNVDITVYENVTRYRLAQIFEEHNDLVHFIGHHEEGGLSCVDGLLSASTLDRSRARSFFLNACGSYPFAKELIRKGSVAGGATFTSVTDSDAADVGTTFARLLMLGHTISHGLAMSARHAIAPRDYTVIGDGTFRPSQSNDILAVDAFIVPNSDDEFSVLLQGNQPRMAGMEKVGQLDEDASEQQLYGGTKLHTVSKQGLDEFLQVRDSPLMFERELFWPADLVSELGLD